MMPANPETVVAALRVVRSGGKLGLSLPEFAGKWPSQLRKGKPRRSLAPLGQFLGRLVAQGLLQRSPPRGPLVRFTVTAAGREALGEKVVQPAGNATDVEGR